VGPFAGADGVGRSFQLASNGLNRRILARGASRDIGLSERCTLEARPYTSAMVTMAVDVERLREVCERYGVMRLEVFGSVARGTVTTGSDVDLLYTLAPDAHLGWAIEDLSAELSALLGKPVDLVSRDALNSRIRDEVLAEAQPFYAAA
jgi:predicted nucleotidyltransferase